MKNIYLLSALLFLIASSQAFSQPNQETGKRAQTILEIKEGWYYINGKKFFVNALGYEIGARPGQHPYQDRSSEPQRVKQDMKVIKEAGFNAIRTWSELYEEELKVVQESGLKIIFGINLGPYADFSNPATIDTYEALTKKVLAYSKKYDCIITYLIMNEPMPQHIQKVGARATVDLWKKIIALIHSGHPGIPVTISGNSAITGFVDMNIFDVYAYNTYDYDGFNYTHGYANALRILPEFNGQGKPLLVTEFGLSVSRQGGEERYGGNTLLEQMHMLPWYYRQLLDAGAAGACPFYYADGWWKGGDPAIHDDTPEEWFGFWGYSDITDTSGYPRPVWQALKTYNRALISAPKNQTHYKNEVPLEIFLQPAVKGLRVVCRDSIIYAREDISDNYLSDTISFAGQDLNDRELIFEFYDKNRELVKLESIIVLTSATEIKWPDISITSPLKNLDDKKQVMVEIKIDNDSPFKLSGDVRYLFSTHIGWSRGERRQRDFDPAQKSIIMTDSYDVPDDSPLLGLFTGTEISYGKFVKTIYDQQWIYRGAWADPIRLKNP